MIFLDRSTERYPGTAHFTVGSLFAQYLDGILGKFPFKRVQP